MTHKKIWFLFFAEFFFSFCFFAADGNPGFKDVCDGLSKNRLVRGDFELIQHNEKTGKDLTSSGNFVLSSDDGIIWFTKKPVEMVMAVTKNYLIQEIKGKQRKIDGSKNKTFLETANVVSAMFTGDYEKISGMFEIAYAVENRDGGFFWKAVLTPVDQTLASYFKTVEMSGTKFRDSTFVTEFTTVQLSGGRETYRLKNQRIIDTLSENEKKYF